MTNTQALWSPSRQRIESTNMHRFLQRIRSEYDASIENYHGLWRWSVENPALFWPEVWAFCGIIAEHHWDTVLKRGDRMPGATWFDGARLNFAENLLRYRDDRIAISFHDEAGNHAVLSYKELYTEVARLAGAMRQHGIRQGDRVAGFMPNRPETIIAMLATSSIGAIWSSCSPDFGINGVLDRFGQIEPRLLFVADGYFYNGKTIDSLERVSQIREKIPSLEKVIVIPAISDAPGIARIADAVLWTEFQSNEADIKFEPLPFDHPLYIMYSSGTTGVPKCIVHGAGGTLIQHLKELSLHTDLNRDDSIFYFTTCGWMMWNWLVSSLAIGAKVVLFDGSPFHPGPDVLWKLAEKEKVTIFGTSAKYLAALEKAGLKPRNGFSLDPLRCILSTGSPLLPESFDYVYRDIKSDLQLSSISGGTDIISCFALGNPMLPVRKGELQSRGLGMKVEIFDDNGESVVEQKGELVCTAPFPAMPIGFWNDPDDAKYRAAYFERYNNIWCHGDYAEITAHDGVIIYGRSDATLNPGGVRIGTAEIYRQVEKLDYILESLAIGQEWNNDVRVVLFVKLKNAIRLDDAMEREIRQVIRSNTTPRHVPAKIVQVPDIPRTISGKIVELAVSNVVHNRPVKNTDALANPDALRHFHNIPSLQED